MQFTSRLLLFGGLLGSLAVSKEVLAKAEKSPKTPVKTHKESSSLNNSANLYTVKVQQGDRLVTFFVREGSQQVEIEMTQVPYAPPRRQKLQKEFFKEFQSIVRELPKRGNSREFCTRSYVMLTHNQGASQPLIGCLGSPTEISRKLTALSNTLLFFM